MTHLGIIEPNYYARMAYVEYLGSFPVFSLSFAAPTADDDAVTGALAAAKPLDILIYGCTELDPAAWGGHYRLLTASFPQTRVIVVSNCTEPAQLAALLRMGVHGHVVRSHRMNSLVQALEEVRQGAAALCGQSVVLLRRYFCEEPKPLAGNFTRRETELMALVCSGASIQHIANTLQLSTTTVNYHLHKLYKRFKVGSRAELMAVAGTRSLPHLAVAS